MKQEEVGSIAESDSRIPGQGDRLIVKQNWLIQIEGD